MDARIAAVARGEGRDPSPSSARPGSARGARRSTGPWLALLALCVVSRLATTIYYIEDPDSLRFALSLREFSVPDLQPHFPGYPVFAFLGKLLYTATGSFAASFSLLGGLAVFGIVFYLLRILDLDLDSLRGGLVAGLVFFNPLVWLMSNRYMPDLLGVALVLAAFYHLVGDERDGGRAAGFFGAGLLGGLRLSYVPFLLPALVAALLGKRVRGTGPRGGRGAGAGRRSPPARADAAGAGPAGARRASSLGRNLAWGAAGVLVWLVPLVVLTGPRELVDAALSQTRGHFTDFGGTVVTEPNGASRALGLVESVWADGLGGYWFGRHPVTLVVSAGVLGLLVPGLRAAGRRLGRRTALLAAASWGTYLVWIGLYQNVIHKSRHALPLLPFVLAALALGAARAWRGRGRGVRAAVAGAGLACATVTGVLVIQHRSPTAIAQAAERLREPQDGAERYVVSIGLANDYLEAVGVPGTFLSVEDSADLGTLDALTRRAEPARIHAVGAALPLPGLQPVGRDTFYHNPYVNRMWSEVEVYEYAVAP